MLNKVKINKKIKPDDFLKYSSAKQREDILKLAKDLRGRKILHVNATAEGGGVAEIMKSLIPYMKSLGVNAYWYAIDPDKVNKDFFIFTNKIHNALQGMPMKFTKKEWNYYEEVNKKIADKIARIGYDVLVVNDPQPLLSIEYLNRKGSEIYYSHIDTSLAHKDTWKIILSSIKKYEKFVFSNKEFVNGDLNKNRIKIFTPAIDPLILKQVVVSKTQAKKYLAGYGISEKVPLIVQVSRFDIWKNPLGVIEAFRLVQLEYPEAVLALAGFNEAKDNPEAERIFKDISSIAKDDPNIFLFFNPSKLKRGHSVAEFTMMIQNAADIIVQNSIKEGFGLTVTEAMWKGKVVIGGTASGIRRQIKHEKNGFIAKNTQDLAGQIINLLEYPKKADRIGKAAHATVLKNFLMPRLVLDHLKLYKSVLP